VRPRQVIAVLGIPGSGKSTQAKALAVELGGAALSVGDRLRALAADGDESARSTVHSGRAIPPDQYQSFLLHAFDHLRSAVLILDGSPRDELHVEVLADLLATRSPQSSVIGVLLELPTLREAESRILSRSSRRPDDSAQVAAQRITLQSGALARLSAGFRTRWPLLTIDATASEEAVTERILSALP
jgi:adenylate kinase